MSNDSVYEMREESLTMESSEANDWSTVAVSISNTINVEYMPKVVVISKVRALVELKSLADQGNALNLSAIDVGGVSTRLHQWTPGFDTLSSSWFQPADRWIALFGIPYHLATCNSFSKIASYGQLATVRNEVSG